MSVELSEKSPVTAVVAAGEPSKLEDPAAATATQRDERAAATQEHPAKSPAEPLAALFSPEAASSFRARWDAIQIGFVDDPKEAVRQADALVDQVMTSLAETFSSERAEVEGQVAPAEQASTENLRIALRRYRSFFQRLLSL